MSITINAVTINTIITIMMIAMMKRPEPHFAALWTIYQVMKLLDEVEQNIVTCQWRPDQLFPEAEG